jgi:hypothetical protein
MREKKKKKKKKRRRSMSNETESCERKKYIYKKKDGYQ